MHSMKWLLGWGTWLEGGMRKIMIMTNMKLLPKKSKNLVQQMKDEEFHKLSNMSDFLKLRSGFFLFLWQIIFLIWLIQGKATKLSSLLNDSHHFNSVYKFKVSASTVKGSA